MRANNNRIRSRSSVGIQATIKFAFVVLGVCCLTMVNGCSEPEPGKLTGVVLIKGKPVFPGVVMLKSASGKGLSANLSNKGEFTAFGAEAGERYSVAIEPIKLAGISPNAKTGTQADSDSESGESEKPRRREDRVPEKFRSANIDVPKEYSSFETSGLSIDCTDGLPVEPVLLELK